MGTTVGNNSHNSIGSRNLDKTNKNRRAGDKQHPNTVLNQTSESTREHPKMCTIERNGTNESNAHNRDESRLEVKMRIHQEKKAMSYEKEIEELKIFYNIREDLKIIEAKEGKKRVKKYVIKKNKEEIEEEMKKGKKAKDLNEYNKEYMSKLNFNEARMIFLLKSNMVETKANFKGQFKNDLKCEICK